MSRSSTGVVSTILFVVKVSALTLVAVDESISEIIVEVTVELCVVEEISVSFVFGCIVEPGSPVISKEVEVADSVVVAKTVEPVDMTVVVKGKESVESVIVVLSVKVEPLSVFIDSVIVGIEDVCGNSVDFELMVVDSLVELMSEFVSSVISVEEMVVTVVDGGKVVLNSSGVVFISIGAGDELNDFVVCSVLGDCFSVDSLDVITAESVGISSTEGD